MGKFLPANASLLTIIGSLFYLATGIAAADGPRNPISGVIGMYVHEQWTYKHPYAARTWTVKDWNGYGEGLKKIGYNTVMIWPMLEIMPDPLTPSDRASLEKHARVIDLLKQELGMRVLIVLCPNIVASHSAADETFEVRRFYSSELLINPSDSAAVQRMIAWREKLLGYLKAADGVVIIDSDPGGYPGSTNAEFVSLFRLHRDMLDRLRPGIEMDYWAWLGWETYGKSKATGIYRFGAEPEYVDLLTRLEQINPAPWGILDGLQSAVMASYMKANHEEIEHYMERSGFRPRTIAFDYHAVELEPSLPMTNFGDLVAYDAGSHRAPRGTMANAMTHIVQLPNTFAFARGAVSKPISEADYVDFADRLIRGRGQLIVASWKALASSDTSAMRLHAKELRNVAQQRLKLGDLQGLLLGGGERFLEDLAMQLELVAASRDFISVDGNSGSVKDSLSRLGDAADAWIRRTAYPGLWIDSSWPWQRGLASALQKLDAPKIKAVLANKDLWMDGTGGAKLVAAIRSSAAEMRN